MSVHKRNGRWQVKWTEAGGRQRSRTFDRKGDADTFDGEMRRRLQLGPTLARELDRAPLTLDQFVAAGFRSYAATLSPKTRLQYAWALEHHLTDLVDEPLITMDVPRLAAHQQHLLKHGRTENTVREAFKRLSGILQIAVEHGHITANPARTVRKVPLPPRPEVRPLSPAELEALIDALEGRDRAFVLLAGRLGLRPVETRMAPWLALDGNTFTVSRSRTKASAARTRMITVDAYTARDLKAWRLASGGRGEDPIIGHAATEDALRQWTRKRLKPMARKVIGRDDVTLYMLRHTHASALHYAGYTVPGAARRMGHSPVVHVSTYAHVIDAIDGQRYADLDALIAAAREAKAKLDFPVASPNTP